jgi:hypothetical protein
LPWRRKIASPVTSPPVAFLTSHHLYDPSRRLRSAAFALLVEALRWRAIAE